jgi:hypothetical protein
MTFDDEPKQKTDAELMSEYDGLEDSVMNLAS